MTDFRSIIRILAEHRIQFILVGGVAATAHGSVRLTKDIDIVYSRGSENIARIVSALGPYQPYLRGAPPGLPFRWDEKTIQNGLNFTLDTTLGALDLLGEITGGGTYEDILPDSNPISLFGVECMCLGLEKLIQVKRAAGRPKDFEAIAELTVILEERKHND